MNELYSGIDLSSLSPEFLQRLRQTAEAATTEQRAGLSGPTANSVSARLIELKMQELLLQGEDNLTQAFAQGAIEDGTFIGDSKDTYAHLLGSLKSKHAIHALSESGKSPRKPRRKLLKGG